MPSRLAFQSTSTLAPAVGGAILPSPAGSFVLPLTVPDGVTADIDFPGLAGFKFRITDVEVVKAAGAGGVGDTIQVQTATGTAITNAMSVNVADTTIVKATTIDDANHEIAAGAGIRIRRVNGAAGGNVLDAIVYVYGSMIA